MPRSLSILILCLILTACEGDQTADHNTNTKGTAEELFQKAGVARSQRNYEDAAELYAEVERQYPLNSLSIDAQYARAATFYEGQLYSEAVLAFDRFLSFNPGEPRAPKAMRLRALSFYEEIPDVHRDQGVTRQAEVALKTLIETYPDTQEAADAAAKLVLVYDQLAGHSMVIGRTYQNQNRYLAAHNRFKYVVEQYPTTGQVPEAFYRLVETSLALGLMGEARLYGATLGYNFPSNPWYARAYALLTN